MATETIYPRKRPDCPFPGCTGGCPGCAQANGVQEARAALAALTDDQCVRLWRAICELGGIK